MSFTRPARPPDWADTVSGPLRDPTMTARAAFEHALAAPPVWLIAAMAVRNFLVAPFGLQTQMEGEGHFLTRMPVVADAPDHFETGMRDRHLTFTLALRRHAGLIGVTTAIWFNNLLGRLYLRLVLPGHILATRQMAARVAQPLTRQSGEFFQGTKP